MSNSQPDQRTDRVFTSKGAWRADLMEKPDRRLRELGTERPGPSPRNGEQRKGLFKGLFMCRASGAVPFTSSAKFDAGTGWPSVELPARELRASEDDRSLCARRTEPR
ncbi:MAG: peptide-methionine (R)-S-oxide reductase, partial [Hyphomicrobiaceae bacterium]|nr:peptide-methionine (R)-S-oxide reductase [Hyphomicrobiaceae bacterium]